MNIEKNNLIEKIEYFEEIESTHKYASLIADKKIKTLLIADRQTGGIGTNGRTWYTGKAKNIAMTLILYPTSTPNELDGLTIDIAKCMQKNIQDLYNIKLEIKKPNDLILNGKKIGGILTQANSMGDKINYLLISMGFNVNEDNFTEETKDLATSLKLEYSREYSREEILNGFLRNLEQISNKYKF